MSYSNRYKGEISFVVTNEDSIPVVEEELSNYVYEPLVVSPGENTVFLDETVKASIDDTLEVIASLDGVSLTDVDVERYGEEETDISMYRLSNGKVESCYAIIQFSNWS